MCVHAPGECTKVRQVYLKHVHACNEYIHVSGFVPLALLLAILALAGEGRRGAWGHSWELPVLWLSGRLLSKSLFPRPAALPVAHSLPGLAKPLERLSEVGGRDGGASIHLEQATTTSKSSLCPGNGPSTDFSPGSCCVAAAGPGAKTPGDRFQSWPHPPHPPKP